MVFRSPSLPLPINGHTGGPGLVGGTPPVLVCGLQEAVPADSAGRRRAVGQRGQKDPHRLPPAQHRADRPPAVCDAPCVAVPSVPYPLLPLGCPVPLPLPSRVTMFPRPGYRLPPWLSPPPSSHVQWGGVAKGASDPGGLVNAPKRVRVPTGKWAAKGSALVPSKAIRTAPNGGFHPPIFQTGVQNPFKRGVLPSRSRGRKRPKPPFQPAGQTGGTGTKNRGVGIKAFRGSFSVLWPQRAPAR